MQPWWERHSCNISGWFTPLMLGNCKNSKTSKAVKLLLGGYSGEVPVLMALHFYSQDPLLTGIRNVADSVTWL